MRGHRLVQLGSILATATCVFLVACGVSSVSGVAGTGTVTSSTATADALRCQGTPAADRGSSRVLAAARLNQDPVTLTANQSQSADCDTIVVTITNNLSSTIFVTDHHTDCSVVILQKDVNGVWSDQERCPLGTLTRNVPIQPHATLRQALSSNQGYQGPQTWPAGTYRIYLPYAMKAGTGSPPSQAFSSTFAIP